MTRSKTSRVALVAALLFTPAIGSCEEINEFISTSMETGGTGDQSQAQSNPPSQQPTKSRDQELIFLQSVPEDFETHIFVADEEGAKRAQQIIELYKILESEPTIEKVRKYVSDGYIQHSTMLPDGPQPLAMLFASSAKQYPVAIDVHKVAVVGDFAMAHVNFRNLSTEDPADLGIAAVDMYYWGEDGKITEHWDALQSVPTHSANTNTMFLLLSEGEK